MDLETLDPAVSFGLAFPSHPSMACQESCSAARSRWGLQIFLQIFLPGSTHLSFLSWLGQLKIWSKQVNGG